MSFTYIHNFRNNILKVRPVYGNPNSATWEIFACGIQNPACFCRGIRNTAQGTRNPSTDWNPIQVPLTKNPVSSTSNPQSKPVLSNSLTWDEKSNIHRRGVSLSLACKQTLFYFSFHSFQKHRQAREQIERERTSAEREKEKSSTSIFIFFSPHHYPLVLAVNKTIAGYILSPALDGL